jgi:hypothetical protein
MEARQLPLPVHPVGSLRFAALAVQDTVLKMER